MQYFILIKKKGLKRWSGTIPAKKGISKIKLRNDLRKNIKKGITFSIITKSQLINVLKKLKPRKVRKRKKKKK